MLRRFWFKFEENGRLPFGTLLGCGVTAYDLTDAQNILKSKVFLGEIYQLKQVVEDVDVSTLDSGHVLPNMAPPNKRGVWFPQGYE